MAIVAIISCSSTSHLEPDQQLYTGLEKIKFENYVSNQHFINTQTEVEAALAAKPNGALFNSSYYRTPFPYGLWIYNAYHDSNGKFAKWLVKSFGKAPVLISKINPRLRATVARTVLQNYGYFRGSVGYNIVEGKPETTATDTVMKSRTAKIQYIVRMGPEYQFDSIQYVGFTPALLDIINHRDSDFSALKKGMPFTVSSLDAERKRIYNAFRNHGFYYFDMSYLTFQADTVQKPTKVQLKICLSDSIPEKALRRYSIGKTVIQLSNQFGEELKDSIVRRYFTMKYNGVGHDKDKPPVRASVIFNDMKLRHGNDFSQELYQQALSALSQSGIFSSVYFQFTPRTETSDTLDMVINCIIDKPYEFSYGATLMGKTSGRMGPGFNTTLSKNNVFRGGEVISYSLGATYEFQSGHIKSDASHAYDIKAGVGLAIPRFLLPRFLIKKRHWQITPTTTINITGEILNRKGFYRREIVSGDLTYVFQPSVQSRHQFSPLVIEYNYMADMTDAFFEKVASTSLLFAAFDDHFMTKMRYTYSYTSPLNYLHPVSLRVTLTEAGNLLAAGYALSGHKFNEEGKEIFKAPFSQFVKLEVDFVKKWRSTEKSSLLFHTNFGVLKDYGNKSTPMSELFYVGGPSSIRAFQAHGLGPGSMYNSYSKWRYYTNTGSIKWVMNLEYRPRIFGSLYGAIFIDAGNVWSFDDYAKAIKMAEDAGYDLSSVISGKDSRFRFRNLWNDMAVGVGAGFRYDLDYFVIRLDWGLAVHAPYDTGNPGYFNIHSFKGAQTVNFAIGYPF